MVTVVLSAGYIASIIVAFGVGVYVLRGNRLTRPGLAVAAVLIGTVMWSAISFLGTQRPFTDTADAPVRALFWSAVVVAGIRGLVQALNNPSRPWKPLDVLALIAHPWALGIIAAFPALHRIVVVVGDDGTLTYAYGFWIHSAVLFVLSTAPLAALLSGRHGILVVSGKARTVMLAAWAVPAIGYVVSAMVWGPSGPNLTPALMVFPVAMIGSAIVRDGLVDKVPLARGEIFESLAGAVFVTDNSGRVIDVNAAARAFAREIDGAEDLVAKMLHEVCPRTARILDRGGEVDVPTPNGHRVVSLVTTSIGDGKGVTVGRCVILRDVTDAVMQRRELERMRDALSREVEVSEELRAELGDQVIRDSATGLYNRRFLAQTLPGIVESCIAQGSPLSVAVVDIDHFKSVNDSWGHGVGDRVIEAVAAVLKRNAPGGLTVRYGGDEFLVILPGASAAKAVAIVESMRTACMELRVDTRDGPVQVTVSAGVATLTGEEIDVDELLEVADLALYRAKEAGRDRTWSQAGGVV